MFDYSVSENILRLGGVTGLKGIPLPPRYRPKQV
jgi:hypothetical protein